MKRLIATVFVVLYGIAMVRPIFPLVEYHIKLDAYLEKCINKQRPELKCNGQCILMQKLKAVNTESAEPLAPSPVKINFEDYPVGIVEAITIKAHYPEDIKLNRCTSIVYLKHTFCREIFHPPLLGSEFSKAA